MLFRSRLVGDNLVLLSQNPKDHEAREKMCYASMIMGINLANVGTCIPHRMQYAVGAVTDTSHAAGLIALYPSWIKHEREVNYKKIQNVLKWLKVLDSDSEEYADEDFSGFLDSIGLTYSLSDLGIASEQLSQLAEQVTGNLANDKLSDTVGIINTIFKESL